MYISARILVFHILDIDDEFISFFSNIETTIITFIVFVLLFYNYITLEGIYKNRKTIGLITIGLFMFFIAELVWTLYTVFLERDPFPSIGDFFYILGYIPLIYVLYNKTKSIPVTPEKNRYLLSLVSVFILTLLSIFLIIIPIIQEMIRGYNIFEGIILFLYPLLDLLLLFYSIALYSKYAGGEIEIPWLVLTLAILFNYIADLIYLYEDWNEIYTSHTWSDDLFVTFYCLTALFGQLMRETFKSNT